MSENKFKVTIDEYKEYTIEDNGQPLIATKSKEDADLTCSILNEKEERIEYLEHQLHSLTGLYASDKEDMSKPFRLDFSKILKQ